MAAAPLEVAGAIARILESIATADRFPGFVGLASQQFRSHAEYMCFWAPSSVHGAAPSA